MSDVEFDPMDDDDEAESADRDPEPIIDYDSDDVAVRDEEAMAESADENYWDDQAQRIENADLDNVVDELVELLNGRDLEGVAELLASEAEAEFIGATSRLDVVDGLNDMLLRNPSLVTTRADLGSEPIVALWTFDVEADRFDEFGFLTFEMSESEEGLIGRIGYADELSDSDDLVIEKPDRNDLPEWDEWSDADED